MYYLFNLSRNEKNYGSVDDNRPTNGLLGENDRSSEEDPLSTPQSASSQQPALLNIDDAINRLGMGRFHYQILITAGLLLAADSIQSVLLSFLSKSQMESMMDGSSHNNDSNNNKQYLDQTASGLFYPTPAEEADEMTDITMVVFPAALVGAIVLGMLGDIIGRRPVFCYLTAPMIAVFGMGTAVVSASAVLSNEWLLVTTFLVAFGVGGLTIPFDTFSEVLSIRHRGRCLIFLQAFWTMGALLVHLILDFLLLSNTMEDKEKALFVMVPQLYATADDEIAFSASWEWVVLVLVCAIPCVFATFFGFCMVPESPRWLVVKGYPDRALDVLRKAVNTNGGDGNHIFPLGTMLYTNEHSETWSSICNICSADWMQVTSALWATYFGLAFLDHGTMTLTVSVFSNDARQQDYQSVFRSSSELVGLTLALSLIDRWGRVKTQRRSYLGGGFCCAIISLLISPTDETNDNLLLVLAFVARMLVTSGTAATWIATSEVLSTEIRTSRHAIANAVGRIGGFVASYAFLQLTSLPATGALLFAISVWTAVASGALPETFTKEMGLAHIPVSFLEREARMRRLMKSAASSGKRSKQIDYYGF